MKIIDVTIQPDPCCFAQKFFIARDPH